NQGLYPVQQTLVLGQIPEQTAACIRAFALGNLDSHSDSVLSTLNSSLPPAAQRPHHRSLHTASAAAAPPPLCQKAYWPCPDYSYDRASADYSALSARSTGRQK